MHKGKTAVIVGAQWGDEGKGKIVDVLSERFSAVARYAGGHNAGHTVIIAGKKFVLQLVPCGVLREGCRSVIGNGVVLDPHALAAEVEKLQGQGVAISRENLRVAENVPLILSVHRELDALRESANSGTKIGTTTRPPTARAASCAFCRPGLMPRSRSCAWSSSATTSTGLPGNCA